MTLASRIVVMNAGRIEKVGTPIEIYRRPRTRFVAGFIATPAMNFLPVAAVEAEGGRAVARLAGGMRAPTGIPAASLPAGPFTSGIRAEYVRSGEGSPAAVEVVERLGGHTLIHARLGDGSVLVYGRAGGAPLRVGDRVALQVDGAAAHLFDAAGRAHAAQGGRWSAAASTGVGRSSPLNLLLVLPYVLLALVALPVRLGIWLSFPDYDMLGGLRGFAGLDNYANLFTNRIFRGRSATRCCSWPSPRPPSSPSACSWRSR